MVRPAGIPAYNVAADPYVSARRANAKAREAMAFAEAVAEFREWDTLREPGELLKIWAASPREGN